MTNDERTIITQFIERIAGQSPAAPGSVPAAAPAPVDREADALIGELFAKYPDAKYRLTQTAFVQEHALVEAQNRIQQLQADVQQARQTQQDAPKSGGFLSGLFGGGSPSRPVQAPPPVWNQGAAQPAYGQQYAAPPQFAPQMVQQSGSGFLGSALRTAAGVAGGVVAADLLMDAFGGRHEGTAFGGGLGGGVGSGVGPSPWAGQDAPPAGVDPAVDQGSWNSDPGPSDMSQVSDNSPWNDGGGSSSDGGGWSDSGGGGGSDDSSWS